MINEVKFVVYYNYNYMKHYKILKKQFLIKYINVRLYYNMFLYIIIQLY